MCDVCPTDGKAVTSPVHETELFHVYSLKLHYRRHKSLQAAIIRKELAIQFLIMLEGA